ncbi:hypothetical protein [Paenibacillus physcomitrellae]|uniref:FeS cluster biogenesis domain-containing protein n=1 Tax=Paenibacillus physcomitrellae TaxID=1619311 RepID=A0ABQ1FS41_9BACL|nr:hypothetical protein [Paenibacillus physcomitrellae]GGA27229.1 hypothetical protein GCM10010917_10100 [Paenibacillus physcomitrellae]
MAERVLVKHAVAGRMLLDTSKEAGVTYEVSRSGGETVIELLGVAPEIGAAVMSLKEELNLFLFEEPEQGDTIKHWFYVNSGDKVHYEENGGVLRISAGGEIIYNPKDYWE